MSVHTINDAVRIEFDQRRWHVAIRVTKADGGVEEFIASADSATTGGSGIYFATKAVYDADMEAL